MTSLLEESEVAQDVEMVKTLDGEIDNTTGENLEIVEEVDYTSMTKTELKAIAKSLGIEGYSSMSKSDLLAAIKGRS